MIRRLFFRLDQKKASGLYTYQLGERMKRQIVLLLIVAAISSCPASAQKKPVDKEGHQWWQHAVFYEIYPRSFADGNNDGTGDINGITSKLDYLRWLGVDAIWLTPMFPSPQVDFGYDVSDYENVNPEYGTLADMDRLIATGTQKNVRVVLDFVVNHTSDKHPWFIASSSSKTDPKRDWYIWRNGKGENQPPNNWYSTFGGPAWKFDSRTGQWYYHYFYAEQPDLNWRNPAVKKAMFDVTRWWYQRGVAGFRLDAVDTLFEDPNLTNNPVIPGKKNAFGDPVEDRINNTKLPELHDALKGLRTVADQYDAVLIGETWTKDSEELKRYYAEGKELHMPMDLMLTSVNKVSAPAFRVQIAQAESLGGWPTYVMSNHDIRRVYDRYGDGQHNDQIAKLMASLYLTLRGTPIMYYGEELGMENNDPKRIEDVQDPIGKRGWPEEKGRDGERTPMQWNTSANAGFSSKRPWNPVDPRYPQYNVETERRDPNSILNYYQHLLALRHTNPALLDGKYVALNENDPNVLAYVRSYEGHNVMVLLNMSGEDQKIRPDLASKGIAAKSAKVLLSSYGSQGNDNNVIALKPFEAYVAQLE
jgi:alpha-glucosidase